MSEGHPGNGTPIARKGVVSRRGSVGVCPKAALVQYVSRKAAKRAAEAMERSGKGTFQPFVCSICDYHHIGRASS